MRFSTSVFFSSNILPWAIVSYAKVFLHISYNSPRYFNLKLTLRYQWHHWAKKFSKATLILKAITSKVLGSIFHICLQLVWFSLKRKWEPSKCSKIDSVVSSLTQWCQWYRWVLTQRCQFHRWVVRLDHIQNLFFINSAVSMTLLGFDSVVSMTPLWFTGATDTAESWLSGQIDDFKHEYPANSPLFSKIFLRGRGMMEKTTVWKSRASWIFENNQNRSRIPLTGLEDVY